MLGFDCATFYIPHDHQKITDFSPILGKSLSTNQLILKCSGLLFFLYSTCGIGKRVYDTKLSPKMTINWNHLTPMLFF